MLGSRNGADWETTLAALPEAAGLDWTWVAVGGAIAWMACALLSFVNGLLQGRSKGRWLLISLLMGPLGLIVSLFPPRQKKAANPSNPPKKYKDEDFFKRTPPFAFEIRELKNAGRLEEAVDLLQILIEEVERKARRLGRPIPVWYYEQLASVYRKQGKSGKADKILERKQQFS